MRSVFARSGTRSSMERPRAACASTAAARAAAAAPCPCSAPTDGSASTALRISRGRGGVLAVLRAGAGPALASLAPLPGSTLLLRAPTQAIGMLKLDGAPGAPGAGQGQFSLTPFLGTLAGQELWI